MADQGPSSGDTTTQKRGRGRPRKNLFGSGKVEKKAPSGRGRGRPRKIQTETVNATTVVNETVEVTSGVTREVANFVWNIENFKTVLAERSHLRYQRFIANTGEKTGLPCTWAFYLDVDDKPEFTLDSDQGEDDDGGPATGDWIRLTRKLVRFSKDIEKIGNHCQVDISGRKGATPIYSLKSQKGMKSPSLHRKCRRQLFKKTNAALIDKFTKNNDGTLTISIELKISILRKVQDLSGNSNGGGDGNGNGGATDGQEGGNGAANGGGAVGGHGVSTVRDRAAVGRDGSSAAIGKEVSGAVGGDGAVPTDDGDEAMNLVIGEGGPVFM